jgi:hypothetical protein
MWTICHVGDDSLRLQYGSMFTVDVPCLQDAFGAQRPKLNLLPRKEEKFDCFSSLSRFRAQLVDNAVASKLSGVADCERVRSSAPVLGCTYRFV